MTRISCIPRSIAEVQATVCKYCCASGVLLAQCVAVVHSGSCYRMLRRLKVSPADLIRGQRFMADLLMVHFLANTFESFLSVTASRFKTGVWQHRGTGPIKVNRDAVLWINAWDNIENWLPKWCFTTTAVQNQSSCWSMGVLTFVLNWNASTDD